MLVEVLLYIVALHFLCGAISAAYYAYLCWKDKAQIDGIMITKMIMKGYFTLAVVIVISMMISKQERRDKKNEKYYENYYE